MLAGGGHAHVEVLRRFGLDPLPGVELLLVSPLADTPYSGMLPGLVAGHYDRAQCHIDLERLCAFAGARLLRATVDGLRPAERAVHLTDGRTLSFDVLSLDIGSTPPLEGIAGADLTGIRVKPVEGFLAALDVRIGDPGPWPDDIAVVGGGAGGIELVLSLQHRFRMAAQGSSRRIPRFRVVAAGAGLLPGHGQATIRRLQRALRERGIEVLAGAGVREAAPGALRLEDGRTVAAAWTVWATGAAAPPWLAGTGLDVDDRGFVRVSRTLQSTSHPFIFAAGDVASLAGSPLPKCGVHAVRQGPPLAGNLRRVLLGRPAVPYRPQRRTLSLVSTGDRYAIASWGPVGFGGAWVWCWKDRIDRAFMQRYARLPRLPANPRPR